MISAAFIALLVQAAPPALTTAPRPAAPYVDAFDKTCIRQPDWGRQVRLTDMAKGRRQITEEEGLKIFPRKANIANWVGAAIESPAGLQLFSIYSSVMTGAAAGVPFTYHCELFATGLSGEDALAQMKRRYGREPRESVAGDFRLYSWPQRGRPPTQIALGVRQGPSPGSEGEVRFISLRFNPNLTRSR